MTVSRGDRVVEEVARVMHVRSVVTPTPWSELSPSEREGWRLTASRWVSLIRPLVAGVIADRLDELFAETGASEAVDHITRLVRREFGEAA